MTRVLLALTLALTVLGVASPSYAAERGVAPVPVPQQGRAVDTAHPDQIIGRGTPRGCTSAAVVRAVRAGGVITFDCGPEPVTITMRQTAKVLNTSRRVVIDGGGLVTLDGGGTRRILYQDTCDQRQQWTTSHCDDQRFPVLVVQHLTLAHGDATGQHEEGGGGGAILARGGRLKIVDSRFVGNRCDRRGADLGGAAIRVLDQSRDLPVYVVGSTFRGGRCSNGGALSSIGVSWQVLNSTFVGNRVAHNGGAIYLDGNRFTLDLGGSLVRSNRAGEGGGAVFFVSNDRTGTMRIRHSTLERNRSAGFETRGLPGIFFLGARRPSVTDSVLR